MNKLKKRAIGILGATGQGRKRLYNTITDEKIKEMMELNFPDRSKAKIKWAVKACNDWRSMRLDEGVDQLDNNILYSDIQDLPCITKENLEYCLCRFICEVRKSTDGTEYPGHTLYQMACALQNYLKKKGLMWKVVHGSDFQDFNRELDRVMQERAQNAIGMVKRQAEVISMDFENKLWKRNIL